MKKIRYTARISSPSPRTAGGEAGTLHPLRGLLALRPGFNLLPAAWRRSAGAPLRGSAARLFSLTAAVILLAGCTKDPDSGRGGGIDAEGRCEVAFSLSLPRAEIAENRPRGAKAAGTVSATAAGGVQASGNGTQAAQPATRAVDEQAIRDLWIIQYTAQGINGSGAKTLVGKPQYLSGLTASGGQVSVKARLKAGDGMYIRIWANTGDANLLKDIADYDALASISLAVTSTTGQGFPSDDAAVLPMSAVSSKMTISPDSDGIELALRYLPACLEMTLDRTGLPAGASFEPASVQLRRVPTQTGLLGAVPVTDDSPLTDFAPTAISGGTPSSFRWYVTSSRHSVGSATHSWEKTALTAAAGEGASCTYIEIAGTYKASASAAPTEVTYRLWPGGNNTDDYNMLPGYLYRMTIAPVGADRADMRITTHAGGFGLGLADPGGDYETGKEWKSSTLAVDENGILVLKKGSDRGRMLFFRFGSVVGFTQEGDWAADKVLFNPVEGSPDYSDYTSIPVYASADYSAGRTNVSDPAYHNGANVKAGKGDPCKLVGLSVAQIQGMTAAELDAYDSGWHIATKEEQCSFTGQTANESYSAHWTVSDARYDQWYYSTGSAGGYFPKGQEGNVTTRHYLPVAGFRLSNGSTYGVGSEASYWSCEALGNEFASRLHFLASNVNPLHYNHYAYGMGARCVKPELAVDENSILVLSGNGTKKMLFFQFGSVVGFTQEGDWAADKVLFNPVTGSPDYSNYTSIPVYASADYDAGRTNVSDPAYHNGANVKVGRGDPCKLVGLNAAQIRSMSAADLDAYDSGWRLPTRDENLAFTGQEHDGIYDAHWTASDARYDKWYYSTGSAGGYFPKGQEDQKKNYLPVAGRRHVDGTPDYVGEKAYYWSGQAQSSLFGYNLQFNESNLYPLYFFDYAYGHGARCVRTTP